jgi:hypothetical protein
MKHPLIIVTIFIAAALYDGLLGLAFLFAGSSVFAFYGVTPPNHYGYVQFPAALLIIFALMFVAVARRPLPNRNLIPYGILLKLAYGLIVLYYWMSSGIPGMWKPFAVIDLLTVIPFAWAYVSLRDTEKPAKL